MKQIVYEASKLRTARLFMAQILGSLGYDPSDCADDIDTDEEYPHKYRMTITVEKVTE